MVAPRARLPERNTSSCLPAFLRGILTRVAQSPVDEGPKHPHPAPTRNVEASSKLLRFVEITDSRAIATLKCVCKDTV